MIILLLLLFLFMIFFSNFHCGSNEGVKPTFNWLPFVFFSLNLPLWSFYSKEDIPLLQSISKIKFV